MTTEEQSTEMVACLTEVLFLHRQFRFGVHPELERMMRRVEAVLRDVAGGTPILLTALVPDTVVLGAPDFTLSAQGTGFTPESVIMWNGSPEPTTFISAMEVTTGVNMASASTAVTLPVAVQQGEVLSNVLPFTFAEA